MRESLGSMLEHLPGQVQVKGMRVGVHLRFQHLPSVFLVDLRHPAIRIFQVAEQTCLGRADLNARGVLVAGYPVVTPSALVCDMALPIHESCAVRICVRWKLASGHDRHSRPLV